METILVFLTLSVFLFGGTVIVQLYVLRKKRIEIDETRKKLEQMIVRDCDQAISKYRMQFFKVPDKKIGYLTQVKLSHETVMQEFYVAFANENNAILGYAKFTRHGNRGQKGCYCLTEILPATATSAYPVLALNNELYTLPEALSANETIDTKLDKLIKIRTAYVN